MDFKIKERYTMEDLLKIVKMLRDKDNGCPWDKVQTHQSIRKNFIEETYEAVEAIDLDDKELMQEELGDVLLQILLHSQFEAEENVFSFEDVADGISKKLIMRHPHIFSGYDNKTVDGVLAKWEEIKKQEKGQETVSQTLDAVPKSFPALMYTQKLIKRARAGKIKRETAQEIIEKIEDNLAKIKSAGTENTAEENLIGQLLFNIVDLAFCSKTDAEETLSAENRKKLEYFKVLDNLLLQSGKEFDTISNELLQKYAKQAFNIVK